MYQMIAGWLFIAGVLQILINYHPSSSDKLKIYCLYTFFACDLFWIYLMTKYKNAFQKTHVYGSILTIALRLPFVLVPKLIFKN